MTFTMAMALFVSRFTILVQAFHPPQRPLRVSATRTSLKISDNKRRPFMFMDDSIYECCSSYTTNRKTITSLSLLSSRLFAVSYDDDNPKRRQGRIRRYFRTVISFLYNCRAKMMSRRSLRTLIVSVAFFFAIHGLVLDPALAAGSNGRMGGSYGRSNRYQHTINRPRPSRQQHRPARARAPIRVVYPSRLRTNRYRSYNNFHQSNGEQVSGELSVVTSPDGTMANVVRKHDTHPFSDSRYSASDVVLAAGITAVVTNGVLKQKKRNNNNDDDDPSRHPLGPGVSVWSLTACLNVPDKNDPTSIIHRLQRLSETISTKKREGLQHLLAETSLELSRQVEKGAMMSVESRYNHFRSGDQSLVRAERQYNRISTKERSKFDRESWGSYNGKTVRDNFKKEESFVASNGNATLALVQIHLVIEGNSMQPFGQRQVETRMMLKEALVQLSGDVTAVADCVVVCTLLVWCIRSSSKPFFSSSFPPPPFFSILSDHHVSFLFSFHPCIGGGGFVGTPTRK